MKNFIVAIIIFALTLPLAGCGNKATLDRVGAIAVTAVNAASVELDQLCAGGSLDPRKCESLKPKLAVAKVRAKQFSDQLAAFGAITPGNVGEITLQFASFTTFLQQILADAGLAPDSLPIRILTFAVNTLIAASAVIAGIHPPAVVDAAKATGIARRNPTPAQVKVALPATDAQVQASLKRNAK